METPLLLLPAAAAEWGRNPSMGSWIASHCAGDRRLLLAFIVPGPAHGSTMFYS